MNNAVAIIGVSLNLPEAKDLHQYYNLLSKGLNCVKPISKERLSLLNLDLEDNYLKSSLVDNIDVFDYEFFGLSKFEAEYMDPQLRQNLYLSCAAIESAGYTLKDFSGTETAIYTVNSDPNYYQNFNEFPSVTLTGNDPGMYAGRVAHFLNTNGPSLVINTLCSSFSVALHEASLKIKYNEVKCALVGGMGILGTFRNSNGKDELGVISPDSICRPFDNEANGIVESEGGGYILLKNLDDAIKDNDTILAVLKGSAINHDGKTSNGITAPSPEAQTNVLIKCWKNANVHPEAISYIETHGTATELGDAIEFESLNKAFKQSTSKHKVCAIGSVKSNFGHIGNMSGFAGVVKAILTVQHRTLFPSLNFNTPNTFIDYDNASIYVNSALKKLTQKEPVIVGVSSFGLSGTNAHTLIEEYVGTKKEQREITTGVLTLSAKNEASVVNYAQKLSNTIQLLEATDLYDITGTQNQLRQDYPYRSALLFTSREDLISKLKNNIEKDVTSGAEHKDLNFFFTSKIGRDIDITLIENETFKSTIALCLDLINEEQISDDLNTFMLQLALYKTLISLGIVPDKVLGEGLGKMVVGVALEELTIEDAITCIKNKEYETKAIDTLKFSSYMEQVALEKTVILVEFSDKNNQTNYLSHLDSKTVKTIYLYDTITNCLDFSIAQFYRLGYDINFKNYYQYPFNKVVLPTYAYTGSQCWIYPKTNNEVTTTETTVTPVKNKINAIEDVITDTENTLIQIFGNTLKKEELSIHDDFYDLGGNSLLGIKILNEINNTFDIAIKIEHLFFNSKIHQLAKYIEVLDAYSETTIIPIVEQENYELSNAQNRLWSVLKQQDFQNNGYNLTDAFIVKDIEVNAFESALETLIKRHEILRTNFTEVLGKPRQVIREDVDFYISKLDKQTSEIDINDTIKEQQNEYFDLEHDVLLRVTLIQLNPREYCFVLTIHHLIIDVWSLNTLIDELQVIYSALINKVPHVLPELTLHYKDYAAWHNVMIANETDGIHKKYWQSKIPNTIKKINLESDFERPELFSYKGDKVESEFPSHLIPTIHDIEKAYKVTSFMLWQALLKAFLFKTTETNDLIIGSPFANRPSVDFDNQIGLYLDTLPIYDRIEDEDTLSSIITKVKTTILEAFEHQIYPLNNIISDLNLKRDASRSNPLFDIMMVYLNDSDHESPRESINFQEYILGNNETVSKFDMIFYILESENKIKIAIEYNTDIYKEETTRKHIEVFIDFVQRILKTMDTTLGEMYFDYGKDVISPTEQEFGDFNF